MNAIIFNVVMVFIKQIAMNNTLFKDKNKQTDKTINCVSLKVKRIKQN